MGCGWNLGSPLFPINFFKIKIIRGEPERAIKRIMGTGGSYREKKREGGREKGVHDLEMKNLAVIGNFLAREAGDGLKNEARLSVPPGEHKGRETSPLEKMPDFR